MYKSTGMLHYLYNLFCIHSIPDNSMGAVSSGMWCGVTLFFYWSEKDFFTTMNNVLAIQLMLMEPKNNIGPH